MPKTHKRKIKRRKTQKMRGGDDVYEGSWKDGKLEGHGRMTYTNGDVYEGSWKDGELEGYGKMNYHDGSFYEGEWKDSKKHGHGKFTFIHGSYEGEFKNDRYDGNGKMTFDGNFYDGNWKDGQMHGQGVMKYANRDMYSGYWKNGKKYKGEMKYINGNTYRGDWLREKKEGRGKMTYINGDVYDGQWKNDKKNGEGKMVYGSNRGVYEGQWLNDKRHGEGKMIYANGTIDDGYWKNDIFIKPIDAVEPGIVNPATIDVYPDKITIKTTDIQDDPISLEDINIVNYMQESPNNILFYYHNRFHFIDRDTLQKLNDERNETNNALVYICKQVYPMGNLSEDRFKNKDIYFRLKMVGLYGVVPLAQLRTVITESHQCYVIVPTNETAPSLANYNYTNTISTLRCQEGQSEEIYTIQKFTPEIITTTGGKNTKRNETKGVIFYRLSL